MLRFTGSQRVGHDRATELNWTELRYPEVTKKDDKKKSGQLCDCTEMSTHPQSYSFVRLTFKTSFP